MPTTATQEKFVQATADAVIAMLPSNPSLRDEVLREVARRVAAPRDMRIPFLRRDKLGLLAATCLLALALAGQSPLLATPNKPYAFPYGCAMTCP